jgi:two-component system sensor histidine kinase TctE
LRRHPAQSLRRQLLLWLLVATAVFGVLALIDTYREAVKTASRSPSAS